MVCVCVCVVCVHGVVCDVCVHGAWCVCVVHVCVVGVCGVCAWCVSVVYNYVCVCGMWCMWWCVMYGERQVCNHHFDEMHIRQDLTFDKHSGNSYFSNLSCEIYCINRWSDWVC